VKFLSFLLKDKEYREYAKTQSAYPCLKSFAAESPLYAEGGPLAVAFEQGAVGIGDPLGLDAVTSEGVDRQLHAFKLGKL
ncbi:hypothetical protein ACC809_37355, partial [Rhizobium johnstonii]